MTSCRVGRAGRAWGSPGGGRAERGAGTVRGGKAGGAVGKGQARAGGEWSRGWRKLGLGWAVRGERGWGRAGQCCTSVTCPLSHSAACAAPGEGDHGGPDAAHNATPVTG